jgi:hypothetical protein
MSTNNKATLVICLNDHEVLTAAKVLHNRKNIVDEYYLMINSSFYQLHGNFLDELNFNLIIFNQNEFIKDNLSDSTSALSIFLKKIENVQFGSLINLTYSKLACYISGALKSNTKKGPRFDLRGNISIRDQWSQYLYSSYDCGAPNPFSLEFLFQKIINISLSEKEIISKSKRDHICISLKGDNSTLKATEISNFIYSYLKNHKTHDVVLIPNSTNSQTLQSIVNQDHLEFFNKKVIIAEPQKSFAYLNQCVFHITDDDFFSSVSSVYLKPTIQVFSSYEELITNSRLQLNSVLIAQNSNSIISHNLLNECSEAILRHGEISKELQSLSPLIYGKNKIYSSFHKSGCFLLNQVTKSTITLDELINEIQFYLYNLVIDDVELISVKSIDVKNLANELSNLQSGLQFIFELGEHYQNAAELIFKESQVDSPKISVIKKYAARVAEIEILLEQIGKKFPELLGFINFNLTYQRNIEDESVQKMSEKHVLAAHQLKTLTSAFYELIESILSRYNNKRESETTI